jgi:hypothetical protein
MADPFSIAALASMAGFAGGGATTALMAGGAALSAGSAIQTGNAQRKSANFQAEQMRQQAGQELAASQKQADAVRRETTLTQSRVNAIASASGGASDVGVLNILGDIGNAGEYNALSALYSGKERAIGLQTGANAQVIEGRQSAKAGKISAAGSLLSAGAQIGQYKSMYEKYNPVAKRANPYTGAQPFSYS